MNMEETSEICDDGAAILEVTDATCDDFSKSTLLLLETEESVAKPDESTKPAEENVGESANAESNNEKVEIASEKAKSDDGNQSKNGDYQNSTICRDFENTVVKQAVTTSTPYKQCKRSGKDLDDRHLWVYNINPCTTARKLKEDLSKYGNALVAKIVKNGGNYYGYALMENAGCVLACIGNLHGKAVDGYRLELRTQPPNKRSGEDCEGKLSEEKEIKKVKECEKLVRVSSKKDESGEKKERRSVSSVDEVRKTRKRSRSSDPLTLKVKERKKSPETSECRLRRMELELERMRQRERDRERQFERRMEREERTLFLKRQIEADRLKIADEKRKLDEEKSKLGDERRRLDGERVKLSADRRKLEDDSKKDRAEVERLQRKLRETEDKLEEERRKRKRTPSLSKGGIGKEPRTGLAQPRTVEDRTDPWSSIDGKKYYKESEMKRYEEEKKKFRSEVHVVSSSSSRGKAPFAGGSASRRFEGAVAFPPQQSRGYGEYGFHSRAEPSMSIPTVQSWNRATYPPLQMSKGYPNYTLRNPYNSTRKY